MTCLVETLNTFRCFAYNYKDRTSKLKLISITLDYDYKDYSWRLLFVSVYVYGYINPVGGTTSYVGVYATKVLDSFAKIYLLGWLLSYIKFCCVY